MTWFRIENLNGGGGEPRRAEIYILEQIGKDWWDGSGVTAGEFIRAVDALGQLDEILLRINSPGGDVADGITILNYLRQHPATVNVRVEGQAASIASVIAMAGETVTMGIGTTMFVHDPAGLLLGAYQADELRAIATDLDKIRAAIVDAYALKSSLSRDDVLALMKDATRMTAEEAVTWGFADATDETVKAAACADLGEIMAQARDQAGAAAEAARARAAQAAELEAMRAELARFRASAEPAPAAEVLAACSAAGLEARAQGWVEAELTRPMVEDRVRLAGEIRDLCQAAHIDPAPYLDAIDTPAALLRTAFQALQAAADPDIQGTHAPGARVSRASVIDIDAIYRARKRG